MQKKQHMVSTVLQTAILSALICVCFASVKVRYDNDPGLLEHKSPSQAEESKPIDTPAPSPVEPKEDVFFTISAIGDLTLASHQNLSDASEWSYTSRMNGDYSYPFQNTIAWLASDDLTIGNLECTFSDKKLSSSSLFYFRAPADRANILPSNSIEFVTTANNHTMDFGERGYNANLEALDAVGQVYGTDEQAQLYLTASGLNVGIYTVGNNSGSGSYVPSKDSALKAIKDLKSQGAEYVICMFHWGQELHYIPSETHVELAHACIDAGANLIYGTHPHCLQPIEEYNGGIILYSMGNFSFGGNTDPTDWDTAIVQISVKRDSGGIVSNDGWSAIPCRCSEDTKVNDYKPTPYEEGSEGYARIMSKLLGTFDGSNKTKDYTSWYAAYS